MLVAAWLVGFTVAPRIAAARRGERALDLGMQAGLVPLDAIAFLDDNGLDDRLYNDLEVGSYLAWHAQGRRARVPGPAHQRLPACVSRRPQA